jgi:S-formylglutathione hydrolase FrmB
VSSQTREFGDGPQLKGKVSNPMGWVVSALLATFISSAGGATTPPDANAVSADVTVSAARRDGRGFWVHKVVSPYQAGSTQIRVLLREPVEGHGRYPVVYVLPVEAQNESQYGDGLREVQANDLQNRYHAIFVAPTFSQLPWYADHPSDPLIRQETYFLQVVVPFIERTYPVITGPRGRLLLGFSKSGWGAWSLLLRHREVFGRAVAWDAPLMMQWPSQYPGSAEIFGTRENFERYQIQHLVREQGSALGGGARLLLAGYSDDSDHFRAQHQKMHALLEKMHIPHEYRDGPERKHDWHSGWVSEAAAWLLSN